MGQRKSGERRRHPGKILEARPGCARGIRTRDLLRAASPALLQPPINVVARYSKFPAFPAQDLIFVPPR
jgi:hypothetical protein